MVVLGSLRQLVPLECVELYRAGSVVSVLSCDLLSRFYGENWSPPLLILRAPNLQSDVVVARTWDLITLVFTGISEIDLLAYNFQLSPLLGPFSSDAVVIG